MPKLNTKPASKYKLFIKLHKAHTNIQTQITSTLKHNNKHKLVRLRQTQTIRSGWFALG